MATQKRLLNCQRVVLTGTSRLDYEGGTSWLPFAVIVDQPNFDLGTLEVVRSGSEGYRRSLERRSDETQLEFFDRLVSTGHAMVRTESETII